MREPDWAGQSLSYSARAHIYSEPNENADSALPSFVLSFSQFA